VTAEGRHKRKEKVNGENYITGSIIICSSPNIVRLIKPKMKLARHVARTKEMRNAYKVMVEKLEAKESLGRHKN